MGFINKNFIFKTKSKNFTKTRIKSKNFILVLNINLIKNLKVIMSKQYQKKVTLSTYQYI